MPRWFEAANSKGQSIAGLLTTVMTILGLIFGIPKLLHENVVALSSIPKWTWILTLAGLAILGLVGFVSGISRRSKLLRPERFSIRTADSRFLKGREDDVLRLKTLVENTSLAFLEGPSGSGKSALVQAGLVPILQTTRLVPMYIDLSAVSGDGHLRTLLTDEVSRHMAADRRSLVFGQEGDQTLFAELSNLQSSIGKKPLLIFDQLDEYQTANLDRFLKDGTWMTNEELTQASAIWREIGRLVSARRIHALFVTSSDMAAGLDTLRFCGASTRRVTTIPSELIAPLIQEVSRDDDPNNPVIDNPGSGWVQLSQRLLSDVSVNRMVLPVRLVLCLNGLRYFRILTVSEYLNAGGLLGLERRHVEQSLRTAEEHSGLKHAQLQQMLLAMVDQLSLTLRSVGLDELCQAARTPDGAPASSSVVRKALDCLSEQEPALVRHRIAPDTQKEAWTLYHAFLTHSVSDLNRPSDAWTLLLQDRLTSIDRALGFLSRWRSLLSILQFLRLTGSLAIQRSKFHPFFKLWAWSALKLVPLGAAIFVLVAGFNYIRGSRERDRSILLFSDIGHGEARSSNEEKAINRLANETERVRLFTLERAFSSADAAVRALRRADALAVACLQLDPSGRLRRNLWRAIIPSAVSAPGGSDIALLIWSFWNSTGRNQEHIALVIKAIVASISVESELNKLHRLAYVFDDVARSGPIASASAAAEISAALSRVRGRVLLTMLRPAATIKDRLSSATKQQLVSGLIEMMEKDEIGYQIIELRHGADLFETSDRLRIAEALIRLIPNQRMSAFSAAARLVHGVPDHSSKHLLAVLDRAYNSMREGERNAISQPFYLPDTKIDITAHARWICSDRPARDDFHNLVLVAMICHDRIPAKLAATVLQRLVMMPYSPPPDFLLQRWGQPLNDDRSAYLKGIAHRVGPSDRVRLIKTLTSDAVPTAKFWRRPLLPLLIGASSPSEKDVASNSVLQAAERSGQTGEVIELSMVALDAFGPNRQISRRLILRMLGLVRKHSTGDVSEAYALVAAIAEFREHVAPSEARELLSLLRNSSDTERAAPSFPLMRASDDRLAALCGTAGEPFCQSVVESILARLESEKLTSERSRLLHAVSQLAPRLTPDQARRTMSSSLSMRLTLLPGQFGTICQSLATRLDKTGVIDLTDKLTGALDAASLLSSNGVVDCLGVVVGMASDQEFPIQGERLTRILGQVARMREIRIPGSLARLLRHADTDALVKMVRSPFSGAPLEPLISSRPFLDLAARSLYVAATAQTGMLSVRQIALRALELKAGQPFGDDLWSFVNWVVGPPERGHLIGADLHTTDA